MTPGQRASLEAYLQQIEQRGGVEIVLAVLPTIGDLTIEEAATRLYEQWGIGKKETNRGILLLDAIQERKIRIEVGYGLEGALPDGKTGAILDSEAVPYLRVERRAEGVRGGPSRRGEDRARGGRTGSVDRRTSGPGLPPPGAIAHSRRGATRLHDDRPSLHFRVAIHWRRHGRTGGSIWTDRNGWIWWFFRGIWWKWGWFWGVRGRIERWRRRLARLLRRSPWGKTWRGFSNSSPRTWRQAAGGGHCAIVLYGSGASGHHIPGRSDLNLLVVVDDVTTSLLTRMQKRSGAWTKGGISTPLLVDRDFLRSSTDSYPLEILGMMSAYRLVRGSDPFEGIKVDPKDVRLQAEREIKAKELLLRRGYVESGGKESRVRAVLSASVPALEAILRGMLFLSGDDWKKSGPAFREACGKSLGRRWRRR